MLAQVEAARLHYAAGEGNIEHVKLLISEGADVNARDQQGWTPALAALYGGELAVRRSQRHQESTGERCPCGQLGGPYPPPCSGCRRSYRCR
jgi:hypothetical protein